MTRWLRTPVGLALALLVICAARHYLYPFFPAEVRGAVSKAAGGFAMMSLLWIIWVLRPTIEVAVVAAWFGLENLQVGICSTAYAIKPWATMPGQSICSAWVEFDLDLIGMVICGGILVWLSTVSSDSADGDKG